MSEEIRKPDADQTGGDANAQNASSGEVQLRPAEADAQNPAGEADMGTAAAAGAEEPEGEAGAAGGAADVPAGVESRGEYRMQNTNICPSGTLH